MSEAELYATARELLDNARAKLVQCERARQLLHRGHTALGLKMLDEAITKTDGEPLFDWPALASLRNIPAPEENA